MLKKCALAGLSLLAIRSIASAQAMASNNWTEQALLSVFEQQSPLHREMRAATSAAFEAMRGRTLWPNPVAAYSRETVGLTEFLQAEQQLPISGRIGFSKQAMQFAGQSAQADGAARIWQVRSNLRFAFYRALAAQRQEELLRHSLAEVEEVIQLLRIREQQGEGSRYDRLRAQREVADLHVDLASVRARARGELTVLLSYLPGRIEIAELTGDLSPRKLPSNASDLVRQSLANRSEFQAQTSRLAQLGFEQQAAGRLRIPEPVLIGGLKRTQLPTGQTGSGALLGVSIGLPVFNKGQAEVTRISAEKDRIRAQQDALTQQVSALASGAFDIYANRRAALEAFDLATGDAGEELLRVTRVGFEEGELGILQLLDAYRLKRLTGLRRVELQLALKESELELSRVAGLEVTQ